MPADLKDDVASRVQFRVGEHRVYARETLWCGQRIGGQVHLFGPTGDLDRCQRNRGFELCCAVGWRNTPSGAWPRKVRTVPGYPRRRIDPIGELRVPEW